MNKPNIFSKNIVANFSSQIYVAIISFAMIPLYIKYMGTEAYGLIGFFAMLEMWFNLFDMGLTSTIARETARFRGGATNTLYYRQLLLSLEVLFLLVALLAGVLLFVSAHYIAHDWLKANQLPKNEIKTALQLMAIIIALRWMCGLYRGTITGSEHLVWLGGLNAFIATIRFIGIFLVLIFIGVTPSIFFSYQLIIAVLELSLLLFYAYHLLPILPIGQRMQWSWLPLKQVLKFSLAIAFTSLVWIFITQTDKLILSKILSLTDYGYFMLAILVANGVFVVSGSINTVCMPHLAKLEAEGNQIRLIHVYRQSTQLVAVIASAVSVTMFFFAERLLWAWTGDHILAHQVAPILVLYASGNGILAVSSFPYLLQYAKGDLHLHIIGGFIFISLLIPIIIWATSNFGSIGAGYTWLGMNLITFVAWLPFIHHKFAPGLNFKWYFNDILIIYLAATVAGYFLNLLMPQNNNRLWQLSEIILFGSLLIFAGVLASSFFRTNIIKMIKTS